MNGEAGYYCVIQYCPDRRREESANLGVLLFTPASRRVRAKVAALPTRARGFFGLKADRAASADAAAAAMANLVNSGEAAIDSPDALQNFVATRANDIRLTAPRLMKVLNFSHELDELYEELVETQPKNAADTKLPSAPNFTEKLQGVFTRLSLAGRVKTPGKVRVPVLGRDLDIPYAYQNGKLNLVKPQVFSGGKKTDNRAVQLAAEGQLLEKHHDGGERQLIVVASPGSTPAAENHAARLLSDFGVQLVLSGQADAFADDVEQQAH